MRATNNVGSELEAVLNDDGFRPSREPEEPVRRRPPLIPIPELTPPRVRFTDPFC